MTGEWNEERQRKLVRRAIRRGSFCTLATTSAEGRPHVTGALYAAVGDDLYVTVFASGRKGRNVVETGRAAVCIPVRRLPLGPPFCVYFQGRAEVVSTGEPEVVSLLESGRLKKINSHGELDDPDSCLVKITPGRRLASYGIGVPVREVVRDPLRASRSVPLR